MISLRTSRAAIATQSFAFALLALAPTISHAQLAQPLTGKVSATLSFDISEPRGDFKLNTPNGLGLGVSILWRLDPNSISNIRLDGSYLTYASTTRRIPLSGTGNLVKLDLKTSSNIFSMVAGPQLGGTNGVISPYVSALGGFSVFWTESSVEGTSNDNEPFASSTNHSDFVLAYGGAAGMYLRVWNKDRPVRIELGARYLRHDKVSYLNDERVRDAFENDRDPVPLRGRADFFTYHIGVNAIVF